MKTKNENGQAHSQTQERDDLHQEIRLQLQIVARETAKLVGLLSEGPQKPDTGPPEYKMMREFGTTFLNELVRTARRLDIQLQ